MKITESQKYEIRIAIHSTMTAILEWYNITTCSYSMDCLRGVNSTEQIGYKVKIRLTTHIKEESILKWKSVLKASEYCLELEHNYMHIVFSIPFANYVEKKNPNDY